MPEVAGALARGRPGTSRGGDVLAWTGRRRLARDLPQRPLLLLIDVQREYSEPGRPLYLRRIGVSLENCRSLLDHARGEGWAIAHAFWRQAGRVFNPQMRYCQAVEGFYPRASSEMVFVKPQASAYSSPLFVRMMEERQSGPTYVAGYQGAIACLSTLIDAFNRGHRLTFVADASHSGTVGTLDEPEAHRAAIEICRQFANIARTRDVIAGAVAVSAPLVRGAAVHLERAMETIET